MLNTNKFTIQKSLEKSIKYEPTFLEATQLGSYFVDFSNAFWVANLLSIPKLMWDTNKFTIQKQLEKSTKYEPTFFEAPRLGSYFVDFSNGFRIANLLAFLI